MHFKMRSSVIISTYRHPRARGYCHPRENGGSESSTIRELFLDPRVRGDDNVQQS